MFHSAPLLFLKENDGKKGAAEHDSYWKKEGKRWQNLLKKGIKMPEEHENTSCDSQKNFKECCFDLRGRIEQLKQETLIVKNHDDFKNEQTSPNQHGEMKANVTLAYRHLEDARMRIGKAIQAYDGGQSCYQK